MLRAGFTIRELLQEHMGGREKGFGPTGEGLASKIRGLPVMLSGHRLEHGQSPSGFPLSSFADFVVNSQISGCQYAESGAISFLNGTRSH